MGAKRIAIIVGAGFSAAAGWPDTSSILDSGAWLISQGQASRYRRVWESYAAWLTANPGATGDLFLRAVHDAGVPGVTWPSVVEVIAGTIASVGANIAPQVSPRYADSLMRPNRCLPHQAFMGDALRDGELVGVVSLNYDLLAEKVLRPFPTRRPPRPGFFYGGLPRPQVCVTRSSSPFGRDRALEPLELRGSVPVLKPHGSLNWHCTFDDWERTRAKITIYPDLRAAFRRGGHAAIVPPMAVETNVPLWLDDVWSETRALLASVDEWRVGGYSLPPADVAFGDLLRHAASSDQLSSIRVWNRSTRTRPRWESIANGVPVSFAGQI
jgi:hypothetical protein